MQIIYKFHCLCIRQGTPCYLYHIVWMFPQCRFNWQAAKGNWPTSDTSQRYWAWPRVGVLARSWCISLKNQAGFEQMLKILMNLLIFSMVNTFSWRMAGIQWLHYHHPLGGAHLVMVRGFIHYEKSSTEHRS